MMARIAGSVAGLNLAKWRADTNGSASKSVASQVDAQATAENVGGTPTIFVGPTGGKLQEATGTTYNPAGVVEALNAALANT
jgi:hypothetical protein